MADTMTPVTPGAAERGASPTTACGGPDVDGDIRIMGAVVARNDADLLDGCLACLRFTDDIVVLDMGSSDDTSRIASRHLARVIAVPIEPIAERVRNVALEHGAAMGADWVLMIDPDERVSERFGSQLRPILRGTDPRVAGYRVAVPVVAFGRELEHGLNRSTGGTIRILRPERARWSHRVPAHTEPTVDGLVGDLVGDVDPIRNHAFRTVAQLVEKLGRYGSSDEGQSQSDRLDGTGALRCAVDLLIRRQAWRDGFPGLVAASFPVMEAWLRDCYAWEARGYPDVDMTRRESAALLSILLSLRSADAVRQRVHRFARRVVRGGVSAGSVTSSSSASLEPASTAATFRRERIR
jgi:hypothetical protein